MSRRRILALVAALVTLLGIRVTVAAPVESVAVLRAMSCCAGHCDRPAAPDHAARCCRVQQGASEPWVSAAPMSTSGGDCAAVLLTPPGAVHALVAAGALYAAHPTHLASPVYLRTRSLRL